MSSDSLKKYVNAINARLKSALNPVRVEVRGDRLCLRATLPPKPGEDTPKQRRIPLGIPANAVGLKRAEKEAIDLGFELTTGQFDWTKYEQPETEQPKLIRELVEQFRAEYLRTHKCKESTWQQTWAATLGKLPGDSPIDAAILLEVVLLTEPHTRNRELVCMRLQKFADWCGVAVDLAKYKGDYNGKPKAREVPGKAEIVEWRDKIPNDGWRWVFGMLACYGLRPHEAFFCEFVDEFSIRVDEGKTGSRTVWPVYPELVTQWGLSTVVRPEVTGKVYRDYGQRVSRQFKRYGVPFSPYDLRHGYAIAASVVLKLPVSSAAAMMGHSVGVHTNTYHRWLSDATNEAVWRETVLPKKD